MSIELSPSGRVGECSGEIEQSIRSCRMPECPQGRTDRQNINQASLYQLLIPRSSSICVSGLKRVATALRSIICQVKGQAKAKTKMASLPFASKQKEILNAILLKQVLIMSSARTKAENHLSYDNFCAFVRALIMSRKNKRNLAHKRKMKEVRRVHS